MSVYTEFSVPASAFPFPGAFTSSGDARIEIDRVVPIGHATYYVWVIGDDRDAVLDRLRDDVSTVDELPDRTLVRYECGDADAALFRTVDRVDATVLGATGHDGEWRLELRFPDNDALSTFYEECVDAGLSVALRRIQDDKPHDADPEFGLSPLQARTIASAVEQGYFAVPRRTTIRELADELGVSEQAVSERLRRGLSALVGSTLGDASPAAGDDEG